MKKGRRDAWNGGTRDAAEREIDDELAFHRERTAAEFADRGLGAAEAEAAAGRRFGPVDAYRRELVRLEYHRQRWQRRRASMEVLKSSVRAVVRGFWRAPGFTLGVVAILTLGLGVNAITFSLVDRLVLRGPSHVDDPDSLRRVVVNRKRGGGNVSLPRTELAYPDYRDLLSARQLAGAAGESATPLLFGSGETAERIQARLVTANYFGLLGVHPALGRFFTAEESEVAGARVAVLSHAFWRRRFNGDPAVIGRVLPVESNRYIVVGVAPEYFTGTSLSRVDLFLPLEAASDEQISGPWRYGRNVRWMSAVVRLAPGATERAATDEMTALYREAYRTLPNADPEARLELAPLNALRGPTADGELGVAALVAGVALLVLLIAFANVANLFLARSLRAREAVAVRVALGGGRGRLVIEQATQGALLALCGALIAVGVAVVGARPAQVLLFPDIHWLETPLNVRLLLFLASAAVAGGALAAALPMWQAGRADVVAWLRMGGQRVSRTRSQSVMLIVQAALSVLLLVGAGLFIRSFAAAQSLDLGLDSERLLVVSTQRGEAPVRADFASVFRAGVERIPGVERTTRVAGTLPFVSSWAVPLKVPGLAERPRVESGGPYIHAVEAGYFETVGTTIIEGRAFTPADREGAPRVAIVNATMAKLYWPGEPALGKCLQIGPDDPPCATIVGIAENTRRQEIVEGESLLFYMPMAQADEDLRRGRLIVRLSDASDQTAGRVVETIRREALRLEPKLRYVAVRPLDEVISPQLRSWRLGAGLFSAFGLLALCVAGVGLYSVVAFDVQGRRREIGVRSALGARPAAILRLVIADGLRLAAGGVMLGLVVAWVAAPLLSGLLYGVSARNASVFGAVTLVLVASAILASTVPALSAAHIEPGEALRHE